MLKKLEGLKLEGNLGLPLDVTGFRINYSRTR